MLAILSVIRIILVFKINNLEKRLQDFLDIIPSSNSQSIDQIYSQINTLKKEIEGEPGKELGSHYTFSSSSYNV